MYYQRLIAIFMIALVPVVVQGLDFDPPLNQGIQFPETQVDETSTVELTIRNGENVQAIVTFDAPQNRVFEIDPLQVHIAGGQQAIMEFSFTPVEAGEVQERINGTAAHGMLIERISTTLRGVGIEGDPSITVEPVEVPLELQEPGQQDEAVVTIGNVGEARLIFEIVLDDNVDWLAAEPLEGVVQAEEELQLNLTTTLAIPERGVHETEFIIRSNDPENEEVTVSVELNVDFFVELIFDPEEIFAELVTDDFIEVEFSATNGGDARLSYIVERRMLGDADADPWEILRTDNIEEIFHDDMMNGVAFADGNFYITGGNSGQQVNMIYILDTDGEPAGEFEQFNESRYGMRGLTYDGELLWGADGNVLYGFTPGGDLDHTIEGDADSYRSLTWDPDRNVFWSADITSNLFATNLNGEVVRTINRPDDVLFYGIAYWQEDPDDYNLYIFNRGDETDLRISKLDLVNVETQVVTEFDFDEGRPGGIHITNQFDVMSWVMIGVVQTPDQLAVWQIEGRRDWFEVDPTEGTLQPDETDEFSLMLDATGFPEDTIRGELVFTITGGGGQAILPVTLQVLGGGIDIFRILHLNPGWNMVSVNLNPDEEDVEVLTEDLVEEGLLEMMKDGSGHFYLPALGFNNIPGWFVEQGYQIKVRGECEFRIRGDLLPRDTPIELEEGWQLISYYPRFPIEATLALSRIAEYLVIAKDGFGNFYIPAWNFSNMGDMREGRGYYLNVSENCELVYTWEQMAALGEDGLRYRSVYDQPGRLPVHDVTGENMSVLVLRESPLDPPLIRGVNNPPLRSRGVNNSNSSLRSRGVNNNNPPLRSRGGIKGGVEIGIYASNKLIGSGILQDNICGIAVWGDDPYTPEIDGAVEGDRLDIRLLTGSGLHAADYEVLSGEAVYRTDGLLIIQLTDSPEMPEEFAITSVYPNPFNAMTYISYTVPARSQVSLQVYDVSGRLAATLFEGKRSAGRYSAVWNGHTASAGIYFMRMESPGFSAVHKVALVK